MACAAAVAAAAAATQAGAAAVPVAPACEGLCAAIQLARERVGRLERRLLDFGWHHQVVGRHGQVVGQQPPVVGQQPPLTPKLEPVSDPKFFGPNMVAGKKVKADYPTDGRPSVDDHFGYPFPAMQDSGDYDKDFVKDENGDNGEWKATSTYDGIRVRLGKAKAEAEAADKDVAREEEELAAAKEAQAAKEGEADGYSREAEEARAAKAAAEQKSQVANQTVEEAQRLLSSEVTTLEDCKEQLAKARQHLEALMSEKDAREAEKAGADAVRGAAEANEVAAEKDDETLAKRVAQEREGYSSAEGQVKVTAEDVKKTESELEAAAQRLKKFRTSDKRPHPEDGGVYTKRSGAAPPASAALLAGLLGTLAAA